MIKYPTFPMSHWTVGPTNDWQRRIEAMKPKKEVKDFHCKRCHYPFRECICK